MVGSGKVQVVDSMLVTQDEIIRLLKDNLQIAQHCMKQHANQQHVDREFQVDDMVFLRLQPYRQKYLKIKGPQKLASNFYSAYKVLQCVGLAAYKLELLDSSKIHQVFHVSYLKKVVGLEVRVHIQLPKLAKDGSILVIPKVVLDQHS